MKLSMIAFVSSSVICATTSSQFCIWMFLSDFETTIKIHADFVSLAKAKEKSENVL